jgi:hypothetical protein
VCVLLPATCLYRRHFLLMLQATCSQLLLCITRVMMQSWALRPQHQHESWAESSGCDATTASLHGAVHHDGGHMLHIWCLDTQIMGPVLLCCLYMSVPHYGL